jgi:exonuclease III
MTYSKLSHLTFSAQNCNSLNISTNCPKQAKKVAAILALQTTFIFLSDTRLNSNTAGTIDFFKPHYKLYHNSCSSKRGVCILISSKLDYTVVNTFTDNNDNILGLKLLIDGVSLLLVSIYGPNTNDTNFFQDLRNVLSNNSNIPTICAGDWNLTYSTCNSADNIDVINMNNPPSIGRSMKLLEICNSFQLTDPFRALYYNKRDYTYVPRTGRRNRSRLDFFLVSDDLLQLCNECTIAPALDTLLFDHKHITLSFNVSAKSGRHFVNPSIFSHNRCDAVIAVAAVETYLQHAVPQPGLDIEEGLNVIANIINLIRRANDTEFEIYFSGFSNQLDNILSGLDAEILMELEDLPEPEVLNNIVLSCNPDTFLEVLMGNIRNALISFQVWLKKAKGARKCALSRRLSALKENYVQNCDMIFDLETEMSRIKDEELSAVVSDMKLFECLHNERPSPLFLNLIKSSKTDRLSQIKDNDGFVFSSKNEREKFMVNYFSGIYKKREEMENFDFTNCIENFLGPDILQHPVVRDSKLTLQEREDIDSPLTIQELDESLKNCNLKSAAGQDGFSNRLIKKCWKFLRHPLFNYGNFCFQEGTLTHNFRSACIKLIPKKGDPSNLKNWRPISLLSNMYKILSRAINERLKKIVNRVCSRAQKGYNNKRYVQEVLINVCDTMAYCKKNGINGCLLALDMAKAFDSIDHAFLQEVYKFYGLGPNMIRWLTLLGNNREACIILDDGTNSSYFDLGTGRPQGDNISPITFNFCIQILIFKLELDINITSIPRPMCPVLCDPDPVFRNEANRETSNNESLADDNSLLSLVEQNSLSAVKATLSQFSIISGLTCNFDKTVLLPFKDLMREETTFVEELGFKIVKSVKLLGATITSNLNELKNNFDNIITKLNSQVSFWSRFRLSMPGRIAISKTFLISQISYLGCVFEPDPDQIKTMQRIINNFVRGSLNISDDRMFLDPSQGGLGVINLNSFLTAQKATWLIRAKKAPIDNWRYDLFRFAPNNDPLQIRTEDIDKEHAPILYGIVEAYCKFYDSFTYTDCNFFISYIYDNAAFTETTGGAKIKRHFFGTEFYNINKNRIRCLKFTECFNDNNFLTLAEFRNIGLELTQTVWMRLRSALLAARRVMSNGSGTGMDTGTDAGSCSIDQFVNKWKRGCKKIRKIIDNVPVRNHNSLLSRSFLTFSGLVNTVPASREFFDVWFGSWNIYSLPNDFKNFIFNCRYNYLPTNNRLNSYRREIDPRCTFCLAENNDTVTRDSFSHCFLGCESVRTLLSDVLVHTDYYNQLNSNIFANLYWYGITGDINNNKTLRLVNILFFDSFRYLFFKHRIRRHTIVSADFIIEFKFFLNNILKHNRKLRSGFSASPPLANFLQALG